MPRLYEDEHIPAEEQLICLRFFIGGCDWYVSENDGEDIFIGFAILNGDYLKCRMGVYQLYRRAINQCPGI